MQAALRLVLLHADGTPRQDVSARVQLSATAAELLQDYMLTCCHCHSPTKVRRRAGSSPAGLCARLQARSSLEEEEGLLPPWVELGVAWMPAYNWAFQSFLPGQFSLRKSFEVAKA